MRFYVHLPYNKTVNMVYITLELYKSTWLSRLSTHIRWLYPFEE